MKKKQFYVCQCRYVWLREKDQITACPKCKGLNIMELQDIFQTCSCVIDSMFYENACFLGIEQQCY